MFRFKSVVHEVNYYIRVASFSAIQKTQKTQKLSTKRKTQKIPENSILGLENKKYPRKSLFLIKLIIKNLGLVKLL